MGRKLYAKGQNFNPTTGIDDVEGLREELDALKGGTSGGGGDTIEIERRLTTAEDEIDALQGDVAEQSKEIAEIGSKVSTLQGSDPGKSVRAIAAEETAKIVGGAPTNYDTLKEIADYISADATGAAELKNKVNKNAQDIGNLKSTTDQLEESMQDLRSEVGENYAAFIEEIGVINSKDKSQDTRIDNVEERVTDLETEVYDPDRGNEALHRVVWGVDSRVDELENNVNNKASKSEAQSYANTAETNAKKYADSLSGNYDAKGSAANAVQSAKTYTDTKINEVNSNIDSLTSTVDGKLGKTEQAADSAKLGGKLASDYMSKSGGTFTGDVTAPNFSGSFIGNVQGTADSAKLIVSSSNQSQTAHLASVAHMIRFDSRINGGSIPWGTGSNNAILHISRYIDGLYTTQLGFSGKGIYARMFSNKAPDDETPWKEFAFTDSNVASADTANKLRNIETFTFSTPTSSEYVLLLSDLTPEWDKTTSASQSGFSGLVVSTRTGGWPEDYVAFVNARTGYNYNNTNNGQLLASSHQNLIPCIVKYANSYYIGIRIKGSNRSFTFVGRTYNLLSSLISVLATDVEVLYEGTLGYNAVTNMSNYANGVRDLSLTNKTTANVGSEYGNDRALHYFIARADSISDGSAQEGHILHMSWNAGAAGNLAVQLNIPHTLSRGMQRRHTGNSHSWSEWIDILDARNFHNYALPIKGGTIDGNLKVTFDIDANEIHVQGIECYQDAVIDGLLSTESLTVWSDATIHGSMTASASYHTSDDRLKTYEEDVDIDLERIKKLPKKYFHWASDADGKRQLGTSAQAIREVYPELVNEDKDGYLSVNYANLSVVALAAVDKLAEQNKALEERLKRIEKLLNIQ